MIVLVHQNSWETGSMNLDLLVQSTNFVNANFVNVEPFITKISFEWNLSCASHAL